MRQVLIKGMKKLGPVIVFALLILLTVSFIWGNSLKTVEQSSVQSTSVAELLRPVLDPHEKLEKSAFHNLVRKLAHVIEFFVLGLFVIGFSVSLGMYLKKSFVSMPILTVLFVAVGDEYIQHFTGRGSLVTDVVLDFAGSLAGMGAAVLLLWAFRRVKHRKMAGEEQRNG